MRMPPWAANSFDLARIMRSELESTYVRENIHKWVDLIFGVDQRSAEKFNLFFPVAYSEYHKENKIERLFDGWDESCGSKQQMMRDMIHNMQEMYIVPSKLFKEGVNAIIAKCRKRMDNNSRGDRTHGPNNNNRSANNEEANNAEESQAAAATSKNQKIQPATNLIDHFIEL